MACLSDGGVVASMFYGMCFWSHAELFPDIKVSIVLYRHRYNTLD
jgi:hypothetical protein